MEIWQYILIAIGILAVIAVVYYVIKSLVKDIEKVHHLPIREKGFKDMPAVPFIISETIDTVVKLGLRTQECKMAKAGLNRKYTLYDATREQKYSQNAYTFMYDNAPIDNTKEEREGLLERLKRSSEKEFLNKTLLNTHLKRAEFSKQQDKTATLTSLFLDTPEDFTMSWTNYYDIYKNNTKEYKEDYASILKDPSAATKQFWPMISENGLAYNLLILQKVEGKLLENVKATFHQEWEGLLKPIHEQHRLYAIDLTIFNQFDASQVAGFDRWTPGAFVIMEQDSLTKKLHPICVQISKKDVSASQIYTEENSTDATWIFALAAARTAVTVYGIWLGHVYHWHMVSAPMQMTLFNNVKKDHDLRKLLDPQSKSLIGFNDTLLLLWKTIGPPTSFDTPDSFLNLTNTFAKGRAFFDDDPKVTLEKFGIHKEHFSDKEAWDRYPIVKQLLYFWDASEQMVDVFVNTTYDSDQAVSKDTQLQNWMEASSDIEGGNVRGLPMMSSRKELKKVITSLVYRVVAHGNSRQMRSLGPGLSFVANYPPCLQKTDIVLPDDTNFTNKDVLRYLPNTGTIGSMMTFYYIFIFSAPYEPLLPLYGNNTDLYFDNPNDPRNKALEVFREKIGSFIVDNSGENAPLIHQWPASIET